MNDAPGEKKQVLPSQSQHSTLAQDTSPVNREQTEVGLELGIADGIELILGSAVGIVLGIKDGMELGFDVGMELGNTDGTKLGSGVGTELGSADVVGYELGGPCRERS